MYGTKKKMLSYNKGGSMPMVMKDGKKVPAYVADGVGKMNMGGMASNNMMKKKPMGMNNKAMAKPGVMSYNLGGMVKTQMDNLKKKNA